MFTINFLNLFAVKLRHIVVNKDVADAFYYSIEKVLLYP